MRKILLGAGAGLCALLFILSPRAVQALTPTQRETFQQEFEHWRDGALWARAQAGGISRQTFDAALSGIKLDFKLPGLLLEPARNDSAAQKHTYPKDQHQAEFGAPGKYFNRNTVEAATSMGRKMARTHARALAKTETATGVPGQIILGIWGRESAYGRAKISHNAIRVLATKGFLSARRAYFTDELLDALRIIERFQIPPAALKSSWAGALGQPQFMPSNVLKYATDGNDDAKVDIWTSPEDTIASIGAYLSRHGWVAGRDWGFEVTLPASLSCALEGPDQGRAIRVWEDMGVARISGKAFPVHEREGEGYLLTPAGRSGPAFIVTPNFYVLKDYNMSDLYALFVGHMGDRIKYGQPGFVAPWQQTDRLLRSDVARLQHHLEGQGHDVGGADGLIGFKTRRAIGKWQAALGLPETCFPDQKLIRRLGK